MKTAIFSARDFFVVLFRSCCAVFVGFLARGFVPMQELFPVFPGFFGLLWLIFIKSFIHQKKKKKKFSARDFLFHRFVLGVGAKY
jgi:hypothetical protein